MLAYLNASLPKNVKTIGTRFSCKGVYPGFISHTSLTSLLVTVVT